MGKWPETDEKRVMLTEIIHINLGMCREITFSTLKLPFGDIGFKFVIKKQETQKDALDTLLSCPRDSDGETCSRKGVVGCGLRPL